jgi:hypothetical protein
MMKRSVIMIGGQVKPPGGDTPRPDGEITVLDPVTITVSLPPDEAEAPLCVCRYDPVEEALGLDQTANPSMCVPALLTDGTALKDHILVRARYDRLIAALEKDVVFKKALETNNEKVRGLIWACAIDGVDDPQKALALFNAVISSNPKDPAAALDNANVNISTLRDIGNAKDGTAVEFVTLAYAKVGGELGEFATTDFATAARDIGLTLEDALDILKATIGMKSRTPLGYAYCIRDLTKAFQDIKTSGAFSRFESERLKKEIIAVITSAGEDADIAVRELPKRLSEAIYSSEMEAALKALKKDPFVQELLEPGAPWKNQIGETDLKSFVRACIEHGITDPTNMVAVLSAITVKASIVSNTCTRDEIKGFADIAAKIQTLGIEDQGDMTRLLAATYRYYLGHPGNDITGFMDAARQYGYDAKRAIGIIEMIGQDCGVEGYAATFALRKLTEVMKRPDVVQFAKAHGERFLTIVTAAIHGSRSKAYAAFDVLPDILTIPDITSVNASLIKDWFAAAADNHEFTIKENSQYDDMTSIWMMPRLVRAGYRDYFSLNNIMDGMPDNYNPKRADIEKLADAIPEMDRRLERSFGIRDRTMRWKLIGAATRGDDEDPGGALNRLPGFLAKLGVNKFPAEKTLKLVELLSCDTGLLSDYNRLVELMGKRGADQKFVDDLLDDAVDKKGWKAPELIQGLVHAMDTLDILGLENLSLATLGQYLDKSVISMPCWVQVRKGAEVLNKIMPGPADRQKFLAALTPFQVVHFLSFLANSAHDKRLYNETPEVLLAKCREVEKKFGLSHWKNYSYKVVDYLLHPENYHSGYDIKIVEASSDWELANAIAALPDYSKPRIEINGHGTPQDVQLGDPIGIDTSVAEFLHLDAIGKALSYCHMISPDGANLFTMFVNLLSLVKVGLPTGYSTLDDNDAADFSALRKKFEDGPAGNHGPKRKPAVYAMTTTDHNGAFNGVYKDIEVLIDYAMDTSFDPAEVNFHSCSTGKDNDSIGSHMSDWLGGVKVTAPPVPVTSRLAVEDGRVIPVYADAGKPVTPTVYRGK